MNTQTIKLLPTAPFDLNLTARYQASYLQEDGLESYKNGVYARLMPRKYRTLLVRTTGYGIPDQPEMSVEVIGKELSLKSAQDAANEMGRLLGIGDDVRGFYRIASKDPQLSILCERLYGLHSPRSPSILEALVTAIAGQKIAAAAARAVRAALVREYGVPITWENITFHAFPSAEALASAGVIGLRKCKLSTRKAEYILEVARSIHEGYLDLEGLRNLPAEEFEAKIMDLRGVGHWTAHWLLIRGLGHPNAFPAGDLALARIISRIYERDHTMSPRELEEFSQRWAPYRSWATLYLSAAWRLGLLGTTPTQ